MKPATIERALHEATDEQIKSENARRNQSKRKVKTGGRNGGRPKKVVLGQLPGGTPTVRSTAL